MSWLDEIEYALERSDSPYTLADWWKELRAGNIAFCAHGRLHGSLWFRNGGCEVAHIFGRWNKVDAAAMWRFVHEECLRRGFDATRVEIYGRKGWPRFLAKQEIPS